MPLKTKTDKLDRVFSKLIRTRDGRCMKCGRTGRLECSHHFSRRHKSTRWDTRNAVALCFRCHRWWHENPVDAIDWLKTIMGERDLELLRIRAHTTVKRTAADREIIYRDLKNQLAELEGP